MLKKLLLLSALLFCTSSLAHAASVTLAWDPNTESDLAGYKVYYGNTSRSQAAYPHSVTIGSRDATTWSLPLDPGVYYFSLTAYDTSGRESGYSSEVSAEIPSVAPPGKPGRPRLIP